MKKNQLYALELLRQKQADSTITYEAISKRTRYSNQVSNITCS